MYCCWTKITGYIFIICCYPLFEFLPKDRDYTTVLTRINESDFLPQSYRRYTSQTNSCLEKSFKGQGIFVMQ